MIGQTHRLALRQKANTVLDLMNGFTPEQREGRTDVVRTVEELAIGILELTSDLDGQRSAVTSKPGAAIRVERYNLTDEEREGLNINVRLSDIDFGT